MGGLRLTPRSSSSGHPSEERSDTRPDDLPDYWSDDMVPARPVVSGGTTVWGDIFLVKSSSWSSRGPMVKKSARQVVGVAV